MIKKTILSLFIFSLIILANFVNAGPLYDEISNDLNQLTYQVSDKTCNSFYYPFLIRYLADFTLEVITDDADEHFYMVLKEDNCNLNLEFIEGDDIKTDILIKVNLENRDYSLESKTFRGILMSKFANDELKF